MGGKLNFSSFTGSNSDRLLIAHSRHHDGVEAPRNSLDLPLETASRNHAIYENFMVKQPLPKRNFNNNGTPVKMLMKEEMSTRVNSKRIGPSVVARLMGMDSLPPDTGSAVHVKEYLNENSRKFISRVPRFESTKTDLSSYSPNTFKQSKEDLHISRVKRFETTKTDLSSLSPSSFKQSNDLHISRVARFGGTKTDLNSPSSNVFKQSKEDLHISRVARFESAKTDLSSFSLNTIKQSKESLPPNCSTQHSSPSNKSMISVKPHRREHPQEELLQKFKKDFEAWQASKLRECSSNLDQNDNGQEQKSEQKKPMEAEVYTSPNKVKITPNQQDGFDHEGSLNKHCMPITKDDIPVRRKQATNSFEHISRAKSQKKRSRSCSPTRIVILKPSSDMNYEMQEPVGSSSEAIEKGNSMDDFLEEVKERLRLEMEGKGRNDSIRRGSAAHTSLHERSTDPKQLARDIAKHIRESVTRDIAETLLRSESSRSYRNDRHLNGVESPESIKRDTRKFISDRLKNVLKDDSETEKPELNDGRIGNSPSIKETARSKSTNDVSKEGKGARFWEDKKAVNESIPKYLRREQVKRATFDDEAMSPPNLIRSFSAPTSGTAFGKLLLVDHRVEAGAQVSMKHEASENDSALVNKNKKDGFNLKGRVSNLKRNFNLKGKIFGKKMSAVEESTVDMSRYMMSMETMPSVIRNFGMVQDNSTEVPPSPASFSSSPTNEHSPVSPLEVPFVEDHSSTQVSGELSVSFPVPTSRTEQVEVKGSTETATESLIYTSNESMHIEGYAEAYVRDVLVLSELYEGWPLDQAISSLDGQTISVSSLVFDEVEEKYCKLRKVDNDYCKLGDINVDRKMLFDLVNEALPSVFSAPMNQLMSKRSSVDLTQLPHGRKLLDDLLHRMQIYANPKIDQPQSVDKIIAWDVKLTPWQASSHEDINSVGRELEWLIVEELIDELVSGLLV